MLVNFTMETARTEVTSIRRRRTHQYFVTFDSRIHVVISTWICLSKLMKIQQTFHVELRHQSNGEDVSIGKKMFGRNQLKSLKYKNFF